MNRYVFILILILCYFFSINNKMYACDPIAIIISNSDYIDEVTGKYWFFDGQNSYGDNADVSAEAFVTVGTANVESWHWGLGRDLYATEESDSTTGSSLYGIHSYRLYEYDYPGTYYLDVTAYNSNNSVHDTNICTVCITKCGIENNEYIAYESSTDFSYYIRPGDLSYVDAYFYIINSKPSTGIENHIVYECEISGFTGTVEWDGRGNYGSYDNVFLQAGNYWAGIKIITPAWNSPERYSFPYDDYPNLKIRQADLDADMNGDGIISVANDSDDDLWEANPGGYIGVGGSRKALGVYVGYSPDIDIDGHVKLEITAGNDKAKLYDSETGGSPNDYKIFNLATGYNSSFTYSPYLQANEPSEDPMDIEVTLSYFAPEDTGYENPIHSDIVKFTSIEADLGVDVDGDSDIDDDDDSGEEIPGGYVVVNGERLYLDVNLNLLSSLNGIVSINIYGYNKVELYNMPTGGDKIIDDGYGNYEWDLDNITEYCEFCDICTNGLYIQGIAPSTYPQDIGITLTYYDYPNYHELCSDTVVLTAIGVNYVSLYDATKFTNEATRAIDPVLRASKTYENTPRADTADLSDDTPYTVLTARGITMSDADLKLYCSFDPALAGSMIRWKAIGTHASWVSGAGTGTFSASSTIDIDLDPPLTDLNGDYHSHSGVDFSIIIGVDTNSNNQLDDAEVFPANTPSGYLEWGVRLINKPEYDYIINKLDWYLLNFGWFYLPDVAELMDIFLNRNIFADYSSTSPDTVNFSNGGYSQKKGLGCEATSYTYGILTKYIWDPSPYEFYPSGIHRRILLDIDFWNQCIEPCLIDMDIQTWYNNNPGENSHTFSETFSGLIEFTTEDNMDKSLHNCNGTITITAETIRGTSVAQISGLSVTGYINDLYDFPDAGGDEYPGYVARIQNAYNYSAGRYAGNIYNILINLSIGETYPSFPTGSEDYNDYERLYDPGLKYLVEGLPPY